MLLRPSNTFCSEKPDSGHREDSWVVILDQRSEARVGLHPFHVLHLLWLLHDFPRVSCKVIVRVVDAWRLPA